MGSITKVAEKCINCSEFETCTHKYMEACAYIEEPSMSRNTVNAMIPNMQAIVTPHNYVDVKIGQDTTITMDVEQIKEQIKESFYRQSGLSIGV